MSGTETGHRYQSTPEHQGRRSSTNVGTSERVVSLVAGGGLICFALRRRGLGGLLAGLLGAAMIERAASGHCRVYASLGIDTATPGPTLHPPAARTLYSGQRSAEGTITIARPPTEVYQFCRQPDNLARFMSNVSQVSPADGGECLQWVLNDPRGGGVEWQTQLALDRENKVLAWRSARPDGGPSGALYFNPTPGGHGTEVRLVMDWPPAAGWIRRVYAWATGNRPLRGVQVNLRRLKQMLERGERTAAEGPVGHSASA